MSEKDPPAWIEIGLDQPGKNRFGVGARIEVRAGDRKFLRQVVCGDSYLSQHPLAQHFGLGAYAGKVEVHVRWPDGHEQIEKDVAPRRRFVIHRNASGPP